MMINFLFWALLAVVYLVCIFAAAALFDRRGQSVAVGVLLALILGPIAVIIGLFIPYDHEALEQRKIRHEEWLVRSGIYRRCPHCAALISSTAAACPSCNNQVDPITRPAEKSTKESTRPPVWFVLFLAGVFGQTLAKDQETLAIVAGLVAIAAFVAMMISALRDPAGPVSS
jgi:formate hydrogenlyase subunit 3/multisubunit Na+/H+ antiporter MnhD subunit